MSTVVLVIHLMVAAALVGLVLLQRSEGGALGIGGGGGGLMSGRGTANALTKATAAVAVVFFITSITLTWLASTSSAPTSILEGVQTPGQQGEGQGILPRLQPVQPQPEPQPSGPQVPQSQ